MDRATWTEAKKKCRLWESEVRMAKELGLSPDSLIRNIPSDKERWKDPPALRIRRIYEKSKKGENC